MRRIALLAASAACCLAANAEVKIDNVTVRQQWPWSSKVKVEYRLSGVTAPVDLTVRLFDGDQEIAGYRPCALSGDLVGMSEGGYKSFSFEPAEIFGTDKARIRNLKVRLGFKASAPNSQEVIYRVYDLRTRGRTDITRADILNGKYGAYEIDYAKVGPGFNTSLKDVLVWTGVTNGLTYKTDKIVFRKIPAKDHHFQLGLGDTQVYDGQGVDTWFTHDFWIAVFELTQTQFNIIKDYAIDRGHLYAQFAPTPYNKDKSFCYAYETNSLYSAARAQSCITYQTIRDYGSADWPAGHLSDAYNQRWLGRFREYFADVLGADEYVDLPTSAQWEFACRAGTTTDLYTGKARSWTNLGEIGRFFGLNNGSWPTDEPRMADLSAGLNEVGCFLPNAFGLYDMLGNAEEMCLDRYSASTLPGGEDPKGRDKAGSENTGIRTIRGCGLLQMWSSAACYVRYGSYSYSAQDSTTRNYGVRIAIHEHNL